MGNRFSSLPQYHTLIVGHGVLAAIVFLFLVPASIMIARFYSGRPGWAVRFHIYLNILTVLLITVVFTLGWFAVGPERSLTNPHHGIGLALFVMILVQGILGAWVHSAWRPRRRISIKAMLHHWLGRAIALLGIAQVALGLTLYGSPKVLFILYALWGFVLLLIYFIRSYHADEGVTTVEYDRRTRTSVDGGTVVSDRKRPGIGSYLAPLAAGAGLAALLGRGRNKERARNDNLNHSRSRSRGSRVYHTEEVIPSRHGSRRGSRRDSAGSFIEEEEREKRHERRPSGGMVDKALKVGAVAGAIGLAKAWWERPRGERATPAIPDDEYSSVAMDTPSRRPRRPPVRHTDSALSEDTESVLQMEEARNHAIRPILPSDEVVRPFTPVRRPVTPPNPAIAAAAISAAEARPINRPTPSRLRSDSMDSFSDSQSSSGNTPQRKNKRHTLRDSIAAAGLVAGIGAYMKNRRDKKEQARVDEIRRVEDEKAGPQNSRKYTGDGRPSPRRGEYNESSLLSSDFTESVVEDPRRAHFGGPIPPLAAAVGGAAAGAQSRSRQDISHHPSRASNVLGGSRTEVINPEGSGSNRRHSSAQRRAEEAAALAAGIAAEQAAAHHHARRERSESRTRRSQSRTRDARQDGVGSPPVSVRIQMHGDNHRNVTLRRLSEQETAAKMEAAQNRRKLQKGNRAAGSGSSNISSLSGTDFSMDNLAQKRRYRRDKADRLDNEEKLRMEREAEQKVEGGNNSISELSELSPPNPAFAKGKQRPTVPKDSAYYSTDQIRVPSASGRGAGVESPESGDNRSHGTWSGMSPAPVSGTRPSVSGSRPGTSGGYPAAMSNASGGFGKEGLGSSGLGGLGSGLDSEVDAAERRRRRRAERSATGGGQPVKTVEFE